MDLRPQSHEIIRTWLFSTVMRSHLEFGALPWSDAAISGWILDPDRKKMSKSKGNVVAPTDLLEQYGSDAVRYWAANGRYGVDTAFDPGQLKVGRRLAIKILNASKFVLSLDGPAGPVTSPVDRSLLAALDDVVAGGDGGAGRRTTTPAALEAIERFFWMFCDDYLELVKARAYGSGRGGGVGPGRAAAGADVLLRLFAPFLPFVTEEVWSWWQEGSVHRASWPAAGGACRQAEPARGRRSGGARDRGGRARPGPQGEDGGEGLDAGRGGAGRRAGARRGGRACARARPTCGRRATSPTSRSCSRPGGELATEVTLADAGYLLRPRQRAGGQPGHRPGVDWSPGSAPVTGPEAEHRALADQLVAEPRGPAVGLGPVGDQHDLGRLAGRGAPAPCRPARPG